jgi:RimJ/RimL family protein N-acetyltransferase
MTFQIREATEADAESLHDFMAALVSERLAVLYERPAPPTIQEERDFIRSIREQPGSVHLVAKNGLVLAGTLDFHRDKRPQASHGGAFGMSVAREYRGSGVGKALLEALIAWAPGAGISRLELQVFENNVAAIHLYERMGFLQEGRRRRAVVVGGKKLDVLLMAREVTSVSES